ncbi:MAG TPA: hypothetical protein VIH40_11775 [Xanthobacteraceae bacterium]
MSQRPTALGQLAGPLTALLPAAAPGICCSDVHRRLALYAPSTIRLALAVLERDGIAVSTMMPGPRRQPTRFYWRAEA